MWLVIIFTAIFLLALSSDLTTHLKEHKRQGYSHSDPIATWIAGICLIVVLVALPLSVLDNKAECVEYESRRNTIEVQRALVNTDYERALLTQEILGNNAWLEKRQYYKSRRGINWYFSKDILELTPIE